MDFLKAEIANKRKAAELASASPVASTSASATAAAPPPNKYMRRGDLEKLREQQQQQQQRSASSSSPSSSNKRLKSSPPTHEAASQTPAAQGMSAATRDALETAAGEVEREKFNVSNDEAVRRLRAKGEPIRLFGESDKERRLRLRALELIEEKGGGALGQNDFRNALQSAESATALELLEKRNAASKGKAEQAKLEASKQQDAATVASPKAPARDDDDDAAAEGSKPSSRQGVGMDSLLDLNLIKTDIDRVYPIIYYTLKGLLQEWADTLAARPDDVKHTMQGKLAAATQVQSADYLKPLFKKLRKRALTPDVLMRIAEIVHHMQRRQYRTANDSYLQLSIGNAPWPIGVTMVGIHERSGREKIFSSNVAHVLNDEVSRKYIQSLKRLMTFAQTKYPPEDISMMMG
ncbi:related to pre-mrna splicing factor 18 [Sporisorium reilianum SRZ2]|uniref:Pre-mRNA-splicing factor 18 n=1 Tax=Sporisorium reilianum (strain SRZ2) TaxID=999809 RepID=E7A0L8_SPORE|nr:related to pre-mrna splicing factor 18 [Sporisorium reilianum SRZ2]